MESIKPKRSARVRPGGRTADVTHRVTDAALELLIEGGTQACTYQAVAERAGVDRSTLYRRYPDRWEMMIDAMMARAAADVMPDLTGSFPGDLRSVLRKLVATLETPVGPALLEVAAELRAGARDDYSRAYFDRRMSQLDPMFDTAIARGELPASTDREAIFTFAAGAVYFRMFIAARGVDEEFINTIVQSVCWLFCSPSVAAKVSLPPCMA